jgi:hypothetical protein
MSASGEVASSDLFPEGRTIFYEGTDPEGFRAEIRMAFGFDPAERRGHDCLTGAEMPEPTWTEARGWQFHCPPEHLDAIYDSRHWPMGS